MIGKHSVIIGNVKTSVSLEDEFWIRIKMIAARRQISVSDLISDIDAIRKPEHNLSSACRIHILDDVVRQLNECAAALVQAAGRERAGV